MEDRVDELLKAGPISINIGILDFAESLRRQGKEKEVVHVDWSPPAGGDPELIDLLDQLL